jgi:hypothetical protein
MRILTKTVNTVMAVVFVVCMVVLFSMAYGDSIY